MSIHKIFEVYNEFQAILSESGDIAEINEDLKLVEIKINNNINLTLLKSLDEISKEFEVMCNPYPDECSDIIHYLENDSIAISEIESVSIILEKKRVFENLGNLDYVFFDKQSSLKSVQQIVNRNGSYKKNIGIPFNDYIETDTIVFIPLNEETKLSEVRKIQIDSVIDENIKFYLSNNKKSNQNYYFNPYTFKIKDKKSTQSDFVNLIQKEFYITMMECLSDKIENNCFILRGEKTITIAINDDFHTEKYSDFINIFSFLVSVQKYTEKFIIIKKVFSLYINDSENLTDLDSKLNHIWKTVNHYYNHYIEDNIKDFFKSKDQLLKEAMNASKVIYEQTDKINNSIVASLLSVIVLIATTIYRTMEKLTAMHFTSIFLVFLIFSIIYYYLLSNSSKKRYELTREQFSFFIKEISIMQEKEIIELKNAYLEAPYKELCKNLNNLRDILILINVLIFISFLFFLCIKNYFCLC